MIIVIGGIKGGTGKTTIATNLAYVAASKKKKVLLVDCDHSESAFDWANLRESLDVKLKWPTIKLTGNSVHSQLKKFKDFDFIVVDVEGTDSISQRSALTIADKFLIPFKPRAYDIWRIGKIKRLIEEVKLINPKLVTLAMINQADPKGHNNENAIEILSELPEFFCLKSTVGYRKSFDHSTIEGLSVLEYNPLDKKACQEIEALYNNITII